MLLDDEPAALIQECIDNFNISSDRAALNRITSSLGSLQQSREATLGAHNGALKRLTRQLHTLEHQHHMTLSNHNPAEHAQSILQLDSQKFRVAKDASDLEIEGERLEGELAGLTRQLGDAPGASTGDEWVGRDRELQDVLRLRLYRSMGIDVESDGHDGAFSRAVVRSSTRRDATVVDLDPRLPGNHYVSRLWDAL